MPHSSWNAVSNAQSRRRSSGMTLVELLVVVFIVVLLLAVAVPLLRPALQDAQLREASRQLNVLCSIAQARARELGRPAGIWIERAAAGGNAAFEVHVAESPQPYSGDFVSARAFLIDTSSPADGIIDQVQIPQGQSVAFWNDINPQLSLVQAGDLIRFGSRGPKYRITANPSLVAAGTPYYLVTIAAPDGASLPPPTSTAGVSYTVFRQPVKSSLSSVQFGGGSVIDLEFSGIGVGGSATMFDAGITNAANNLTDHPVVIMFAPNGSVSKVYTRYLLFSPGFPPPPPVRVFGGQSINGTIYLLIGRFDQTRPTPDPATATPAAYITPTNNLNDLSASWVAISARTGNVTTAENAIGGTVAAAREIARSAQAMGGN